VIERFAVAEVTGPHLTFVEDIRVYLEAEVGGMGVWEYKLGRGGDAALLDDFRASGLRATLAVPRVWSILPDRLCPGPDAAADRIDLMCASVRRLAPLDPVAIGVHTGPVGRGDVRQARQTIVTGLRKLARTAATLHPAGIDIAIEPVAPELGRGDPVTSLPSAADLIDEVGEPNLKIVVDSWQIGGSLSLTDLERHIGEIAIVQLAGRKPLGGWLDRAVPSDGDANVRSLVQRSSELGYSGWYELEVWRGDAGRETPTEGSARSKDTADLVRGAQMWFRQLYAEVVGVPAA
jgi:sugar phosphate isomerase/epimerase